MLNLQSLMRVYKFKDGDREIELKQPSQEMFMKYTSQHKPEDIIEFINDLFDSLLNENDYDFKSLPVQVKLVIVKDYFDFHASQLNKMFPSSDTNR